VRGRRIVKLAAGVVRFLLVTAVGRRKPAPPPRPERPEAAQLRQAQAQIAALQEELRVMETELRTLQQGSGVESMEQLRAQAAVLAEQSAQQLQQIDTLRVEKETAAALHRAALHVEREAGQGLAMAANLLLEQFNVWEHQKSWAHSLLPDHAEKMRGLRDAYLAWKEAKKS